MKWQQMHVSHCKPERSNDRQVAEVLVTKATALYCSTEFALRVKYSNLYIILHVCTNSRKNLFLTFRLLALLARRGGRPAYPGYYGTRAGPAARAHGVVFVRTTH